MLEVRELRYFLEVALTGNITKAAHHLHVTQPCLSRAIKDLEGKLGQRLLVRRSHSVALTPEGALFVERARAIVDLVGHTEREFQTLSQKIEGQVNLCAAETPAFRLLSAVIADIQATCTVDCHLEANSHRYRAFCLFMALMITTKSLRVIAGTAQRAVLGGCLLKGGTRPYRSHSS